jgi:hypothetical protein
MLHSQGVLESRFFMLGRDRGFFELIEYLKFGSIIYLLKDYWQQSQVMVIKAWMILFIVVLLDNAIGLHEEIGELLITFFTIPYLGLHQRKDVAEIMVFIALEGSALLYVAYHYLASSGVARQFSNLLLVVVVGFGITVVVLDAAHSRFEEYTEIIGMTFMLAIIHTQRSKFIKTNN